MASPLNRFNWLARYYDQLATAVFGKSLYQAQIYYIRQIPRDANVLILGGGTGKILGELLRINSAGRICYIEASSTMIKLAKRNTSEGNRQQVLFIHGTEDSIPSEIKFDIIITHFFLDLFSQHSLDALIEKVNSSLAPGALWLACDFINYGKWWQKSTLQAMYLFFRFCCGIESSKLPPWEFQLRQSGLHLIRSKFFVSNFVKTTMFKKM